MINKWLSYFYIRLFFRQEIRSNCSRSILAAQSKLILLFYSRNHSKHQEIIYNDLHQQVLRPDELKNIMESNFSASHTGNLGDFRSGDALLKEINKN